jgi:hypothetical protein
MNKREAALQLALQVHVAHVVKRRTVERRLLIHPLERQDALTHLAAGWRLQILDPQLLREGTRAAGQVNPRFDQLLQLGLAGRDGQ